MGLITSADEARSRVKSKEEKFVEETWELVNTKISKAIADGTGRFFIFDKLPDAVRYTLESQGYKIEQTTQYNEICTTISF